MSINLGTDQSSFQLYSTGVLAVSCGMLSKKTCGRGEVLVVHPSFVQFSVSAYIVIIRSCHSYSLAHSFPLSQTCCVHLFILSRRTRWLKIWACENSMYSSIHKVILTWQHTLQTPSTGSKKVKKNRSKTWKRKQRPEQQQHEKKENIAGNGRRKRCHLRCVTKECDVVEIKWQDRKIKKRSWRM